MKPLRHLLLFACLLGGVAPLFAVAKPSQEEKVYLHFDNTAYFMGETIWFKAYVVQAGRNGLSPLSKTLYVDLITPEGLVMESKKLKLTNGTCDGSFLLKDSLKGGFYEVRAYTRFMLNQGDEAIFSRVFACYDKPSKIGEYQRRAMNPVPSYKRLYDYRPKGEKADKLNLLFFPEGGSLVEGLTSRMAFKAFDRDGVDAALTGAVLSAGGDTLATLCTSHQGMGVFTLTPGKGTSSGKESCKAHVTYNNKTYLFELPTPLSSGYALTVDASNPERLMVLVQRSVGMPLEQLGIDLACRGQLYGADTLTFSQVNAISLTFPTKLLPSGVIQVTLHTMDGRPLAQRLSFVDHDSKMQFNIKPNKKSYRPFEKIDLDFNLKDAKGKPIETEFSLSVRDAESMADDPYADNILTNLLLSSELKGYIQSPGYYFEDNSPERRADLDLLMMTQGWSRYDWKRIAGFDTSAFAHAYEESLLVEGNVYSLSNKKAKGIDVSMTLLYDSLSQRGSCTTDKDGRFSLALVDFNGMADLTLESKQDGKLKEHNIRLDRVFAPPIRAFDSREKRLPDWSDPTSEVASEIASVVEPSESMWTDSIDAAIEKEMRVKSRPLPQVEVNAKRLTTAEQEGIRDASVVIDVQERLGQFMDRGETVPETGFSTLSELLPYFSFNVSDKKKLDFTCFYKGKRADVFLNNQRLLDIDLGGASASNQNIGSSSGAYHNPLLEMLYFISSYEITLITVKERTGAGLVELAQGGLGSSATAQANLIEGNYPTVYIYIYTDSKRTPPAGIRRATFQGYSFTKAFYSPPYDKLGLPDKDDVRRTLYWNPSVTTDANGKANVSFFNNRSSKKMNLSVETVTENGMIGVLNVNQ